MSADEKPSMPEQPKTVSLPAMTDRALLEDLARDSRENKGILARLATTVDGLVGDHRGLHERMGSLEGRVAKIESPTTPPPPPLTSERVRELAGAMPSKPDLEEQAKLAAVIVETNELKTAIRETRTLAEQAATKSDVQTLADGTATKAEVKAIADAQTGDIVTSTIKGVEALAARNKTVRYLLGALAALAVAALMAATNYITRQAPAPQPVPMQVTK